MSDKFFDEDDWNMNMAGRFCKEFTDEEVNIALSGNVNGNAVEDSVDQNTEQLSLAPPPNTSNKQGILHNLDSSHSEPEIPSTRHEDIIEITQINYSSDTLLQFSPPTNAIVYPSLPSSLPSTPYSVASTSSQQTNGNRKHVIKCCKEMKAWLITNPRISQNAKDILSKYSVEIDEALNMGTPRTGRPRISRGSLTPEQRNYFCLNYRKHQNCKRFIASFVNMFKDGYSQTMTLADLPYPYDIDKPTQRASRRNTQ